MFQKVSKFKVFINVRHTGQNKRGKIFVICNFWTNIKKIAQNSKKGQKHQKYLLKLKISKNATVTLQCLHFDSKRIYIDKYINILY